mgnify:CR=1 FL=1
MNNNWRSSLTQETHTILFLCSSPILYNYGSLLINSNVIHLEPFAISFLDGPYTWQLALWRLFAIFNLGQPDLDPY